MQPPASPFKQGQLPKQKYYLRMPNGDLVGGNFRVPNGDFARSMGFKPKSPGERSGDQAISGTRVIELALRRKMAILGEKAAKNGMLYRNHDIRHMYYYNHPGREMDEVRDYRDAYLAGAEKRTDDVTKLPLGPNAGANTWFRAVEEFHKRSREDNVRYLEMQFKFAFVHKNFSTISNLMKVRHDATVRLLRDSKL